MTVLLRATGPALFSWPVFLVVVLGSAQVSALGTGSTAEGSTLTLAAVGAIAGLAAYGTIVGAWWLGLRRMSGSTRIVAGIAAAAVAGLVRGLVVQTIFTSLGFSDADASQILLRLSGGALAGVVAILSTAAGVASVRDYRKTAQTLSAERQRLLDLLDASAERIEQRQADTLLRVQERLDRELRGMAVDSGPSAVAALESLAGEVVRPLSHALARDLPHWPAASSPPLVRVRLRDVWSDSLPAVAIHPLLLSSIAFVISVPAALVVYEPRNGLPTLLIGVLTLFLLLTAGREWILRRPPGTSLSGWLRIGIVLVGGAALASGITLVLDRADPSAGVFARLALSTMPVCGLIIAVVAMMHARMRDMMAELEAITRQLQWNLARVNTQQWEQNGELSRALHGPVQSLLHSRLLRLRGQIDRGEVDEAYLDTLRDDLQTALATALAPSDIPQPIATVLADVSATWAGLATVTWQVTPSASAWLASDPLCAHAVADLATEAVSNAVRHGGAPNVTVEVDTEGADLIRLRVVDDGQMPQQGLPGLGTTLLTRCTYDWSLSSSPTTLTARLPCAHSALQGAMAMM